MRFGRAALALTLLLGVYLLAGGILAALGLLVHESLERGYVVSGFAAALTIVAVSLGRALWVARRESRRAPEGLALSADEHPELWEDVRSMAATVGTRPPDRLLLVPEVNATVWEGSRLLGLVPGRRVMTLGAPLVMGLTRQELRSVLAHELGHYSHRHMALAPAVYRGQVTLASIARGLGPDSVLGTVFAAYARLYYRITRSISRQQEMEADRWSARIAGRDAAASAMRQVPALGGLWEFFLDECALPVQGARPVALFDGFAGLLASPRRQREMAEVRRDLPERPDDPYDSHPSTRSRVEYFESLPDDDTVDDRAPATALLSDPGALLARLEADLFEDAGLEPRPWEWIAEHAGRRRSRHGAAMLVRAADEPGRGAATLQDAMLTLAWGRAAALMPSALGEDEPADRIEVAARRMVADTVASALVEHCGARHAVDWDGTTLLLDPADQPIDVDALVASVVDSASADGLLTGLEAEGVPPTYAVDPAEADAEVERNRGPRVHAVATCQHRMRFRTLVVADGTLIVKRLGVLEGFKAGIFGTGMHGARGVTAYVASIPLEKLLEDRRAEVVAWDQVGGVRLAGRRLALTAGGRRRRMRVHGDAVAGDLLGALQHHLGERLAA